MASAPLTSPDWRKGLFSYVAVSPFADDLVEFLRRLLYFVFPAQVDCFAGFGRREFLQLGCDAFVQSIRRKARWLARLAGLEARCCAMMLPLMKGMARSFCCIQGRFWEGKGAAVLEMGGVAGNAGCVD